MNEYENEIMNETYEPDDIIVDDAVESGSSGNGWKIAAGVGIAALVGGLAYKFVVKPIAKKIKAKKAEKNIVTEVEVPRVEAGLVDDTVYEA